MPGISLILFLWFAASAAPADTARGVADRLAGEWNNDAQYAAAPAAVRVAPSVGGVWLDRQHARLVRVEAPAVGRDVLYLEWRSGSPDGPISRQRIWSLRDTPGGVRMDYFTIARPERFAGRGTEPGAFAALQPAELTGYGEACAVRFSRAGGAWAGRVDPADCAITARSGRRMSLDVTIRLTPATLEYREKGRLEGGALAFDVPSWSAYDFRRAPGKP